MSTTFSISRDLPWPKGDPAAIQHPWLVGQSDRTWLIPLLHRTLASPAETHSWPCYDKVTPLPHANAFWECGLYLLACLLGWRDLGLGLQRLHNGQRPKVESPHLDLLSLVWNNNRELDAFALWAWHREVNDASQSLVTGVARRPEDFAGPDWLEQFHRRHPGFQVAYDNDPYTGGTNPLHLGHALGALVDVEPSTGETFLVEPPLKRAVLLLDCARGWGAALARHGGTLPSLGQHSWHVEVVVRSVGWLGSFRKSRDTNVWFAGKHSVHKMGFR